MHRYQTSGSSSVDAASARLTTKPAYLMEIGVQASTGSVGGSWYSGSSIATGSLLWSMSACPGKTETHSFHAPIVAPCSIVVNVIGTGCAMTAWDY